MKMQKLMTTVRTTEIDDVSDRLIVLFKSENALQDEPFLKSLFAELEQLSAKITEAIKKDVKLSSLEEADLYRDNAIRSLHNVLLGYRSMPIASLKEQGEKLYTVFSKYGVKITKENYATESSLIESLLLDLSASELQSAITALSGVRECIAELRKTQTAFTNLRLEYEKTVAERGTSVSASALKKPMLNLINGKLLPYLSAMIMVDSVKYETFTHNILQVLEDTNTAVKRRAKERKEKP